MAIRGVLRLGEVCVRVMDLKQAKRHYGDRMGLHEVMTDAEGAVYYKAWDEHDHHSIVIREAESPGMDYFAFKVYSDDVLSECGRKLLNFGLPVTEVGAGVIPKSGRRLITTLPTGHIMHLYAEKEQIGNTMPLFNPGTTPDEGVIRGFRVNRLDHVLLGGVEIDESARVFMELFDFDLSEKIVDSDSGINVAIFLSATNSPHDIAFVRQPDQNRFHHVSFLLAHETDVIHAADLIGKYRIPVDVGPNRHGVTRGATIYFFDPSGNRNEVFSGGYVHYPDTPTLTWDTNELGPAVFAQDNILRESFLNVLT